MGHRRMPQDRRLEATKSETHRKRLLSINMVSMHSTSFTIANILIHLFGSPGCTEALEIIREEVNSTLIEPSGAWTKTAVGKLQHIDSTIRESMRYFGFGIAASPRVVANPNDIEIRGYNIPKEIKLAVAMDQVHHDPSFYSDTTCFDALRFSRSLGTSVTLITDTGIDEKSGGVNFY